MNLITVDIKDLSTKSLNDIKLFLRDNQASMKCEDIYEVKKLITKITNECSFLADRLLESAVMDKAIKVTQRQLGSEMNKRVWNRLWENAVLAKNYFAISKARKLDKDK